MRLKRTVLADAHSGAVVRLGNRWGVVCAADSRVPRTRTKRVVDFWDGGRELVPIWKVVEVQK